MAHELSIRSDGRVEMAYAGEMPWHGLGVRVEGLQRVPDMLRHAGLDWGVRVVSPLRYTAPDGQERDVPKTGVVVREDTGAALGLVSRRYVAITNQQAAEVVEAVVAEGQACVEVAGALSGGRRCWMLARIPVEFDVVDGDGIRPYFLLAWGHDGKHGIAGRLTPIRVVCNNTLSAAGFGPTPWRMAPIYMAHTSSARLRIDEARRALGLVRKQIAETATTYRSLVRPLSSARDYFGHVFPDASEPQLRRLEHLYHEGAGVRIPGVRGTVWAAYNAVTEYLDHVYPVLASGRVSRVRQQAAVFGSASTIRDRAFRAALAV
jgi:phage/plasmid-like protein (TIGR03299 family)